MKKITFLLLMLGFSSVVSAQCFSNLQWPEETVEPEVCDGTTINIITDDGYAGEFSMVTLTAGETYTFSSSVATDFITISMDGETAEAFGMTPVTFTPSVNGDYMFYTHLDAACGEEEDGRIRGIVCGTPSADAPDYANLQFPGSATIEQGGSVTVYAQVYEGGLTDVEPGLSGQADGIQAWVGISTENTNPNTWTNWTVADFNAPSIGNNDEYMLSIGTDLDPGTYYYATRFKLNSGAYFYGGINSEGQGNFWNGTSHVSGVLTVNALPAPANDACAGATIMTTFPYSFAQNDGAGATNNDGFLASCDDGMNDGMWYSFVGDGNSFTITVTPDVDFDAQLGVFSGSCGTLTCVDTEDVGFEGESETLTLGTTEVGVTYYINIGFWGDDNFGGDDAEGNFAIDVTTDEAIALPGCASTPMPENAATNVATGDVVFSWDAVEGATSYDFYGGTVTPLTEEDYIGNVETNEIDLTLEGYDLQLFWKVVPRNVTGPAVGCTEWNFTTESAPAAPANDACAGATMMSTFPYTFAQNDGAGATNNDGFLESCTDGMNDGMWYSFVGDGNSFTVTVTPEASFDAQVGVFSGTCAVLDCVGTMDTGFEGDAETFILGSTQVGVTYYVNVGFWGDNDFGGDEVEGNFTIDVTTDEAIAVPGCASNPMPEDNAVDVPTGDIVFTWGEVDGATSYDFYGGTATPLTEDDLIGNVETNSIDLTLTGYDLELFWKVVPRNVAGPAIGCQEWSFTTQSAPAAPANDACINAVAITELPYTFDQNDGAGATNNDGFIASCEDIMNDGVWFSVVGDGTNLKIDITPADNFDPQIGVYSGSCGSFTCVGTADEGFTEGEAETFTITSSEIGTTYYINVGFWGDDEFGGDVPEGNFTIAVASVIPPDAPVNDACANATVITTPYSFEQTDGAGATNNDGFITTCDDAMNDGVWYVVAGDGGDITITIAPEASFDAQMDIYSGECGAFECIATADSGFEGDPETYTIEASEIGTNYYINIGYWGDGDFGGDEPEGNFSIEVTSTVLGTPSFDDANFKVFPNPVKDVLNLSYTSPISNVAVFNLLGQQVIVKSNDNKVDMSGLSSGTYLVKVTSENQIKTVKVVKE